MQDAPRIYEHGTREENLLCAKRAVREMRSGHLMHRLENGREVIDIISDGKVLQKHVCSHPDHQHVNESVPRRNICQEIISNGTDAAARQSFGSIMSTAQRVSGNQSPQRSICIENLALYR